MGANRDKGSNDGSTNVLGNSDDNRGGSNVSPRGGKDMKNLMESFTKEQMYVLLGSHLRKAVEGYYDSSASLEAYERAEKNFRGGSLKLMVKYYSVKKKGYKVAIVEQLEQILESMPKGRRTLEQAQAILDELSESGDLNPKHWKKIYCSIFNDNIRGVRIDTSRGIYTSSVKLWDALHIDKEWINPLGGNYASKVEALIVYVETGEFPS